MIRALAGVALAVAVAVAAGVIDLSGSDSSRPTGSESDGRLPDGISDDVLDRSSKGGTSIGLNRPTLEGITTE